MLPEKAGLWAADGPVRTFTGRDLFSYIDGAAEVYLAYGFSHVTTRRYTREGWPRIAADVFDMGSAADAFGVFSFERMGPEAGVGQGSEYGGGMLRFWKGRYFACVSCPKESPEVRETVMGLGKAIAAQLPAPRAGLPRVVRLLPTQGLQADRVRFFHQHGSLNYQYFLATANILKLGRETDVALGSYGVGKGPRARLLLARYPSEARAKEAQASFLEAYLSGADRTGLVRLEDGGWCGARRFGAYLAIVLDGPSRNAAGVLLRRVSGRINEVKGR
jgi:hypothetical protein